MGCLCFKGAQSEDQAQDSQARNLSQASRQVPGGSRREEIIITDSVSNNLVRARIIQENPPRGIESERRVENPRRIIVQQGRISIDYGSHEVELYQRMSSPVPNGVDGELVAAGWPLWLVRVSGEAVRGWLPRNPDSYEKFEMIGKGTYSTVYRARDMVTNKLVALKKVRFVNMDPESVKFMAREIIILRRLNHPNVIKLENLATSNASRSFYLVFEYMEHDLAGLLSMNNKFTEPQIKCYMRQLLSGLEHCHSRGILHRDIKGSNLLLDNNGVLKIGDFGLAAEFDRSKKRPLTSRVVTLWYRPPELLLGATVYDVAVDLWSSGCILAELLAGKPIFPGTTEVEQLHRIFKLCGSPADEYWQKFKTVPHATSFKPQHPYRHCLSEKFKDFPPSALSLLNVLLAFDPDYRGTATSALNSDFFNTRPLACDPSSLPKYPPSKEFGAMRQNEELRRQRAATGKTIKEVSRALPTTKENPDPMRGSGQPSTSDKNLAQEESSHVAVCNDPPRVKPRHGHSLSGQLTFNGGRPPSLATVNKFTSMAKSVNTSEVPPARQSNVANPIEIVDFSGLSDARGIAKSDNHREITGHMPWTEHNDSERQDWSSTSYQNKQERAMHNAMGYRGKKNPMHCSGPLIRPGSSIEEMLKDHERRLNEARRRNTIVK